MRIIKVSSKSNPNLVAGAIINILKEESVLEIHTIGAGALNQSIKALAVARGYLKVSDLDLNCKPTFFELDLNGEEKTGIKLIVKLD